MSSSYLGVSDEAVIVSIDNQPTQFLWMVLLENSEIPGDMLVAPKPRFIAETAIVFPSGREYYYKVPDNAVPGWFRFELHKHYSPQPLDETTAHIATDYLYFHCTSGTCPNYPNEPERSNCCQGDLEWRRGDGTLIPGLGWTSISGPHGNGRINDCNYFEIPRVSPLETGQNHETDSFTDPSGNRWKTAPFVNRNQCTTSRSGFEIHPDGKGVGTEGCIGISRSIKDTREIWAELYIINLTFGPTKLIVGP